MTWHVPIPFVLVPTTDRALVVASHQTQLPLAPHPGGFGVKRKHHTHEGVDLYCPEDTPVQAVEEGIVVGVMPFTGVMADPPSPWWRDTSCVLVEGATGVVVYGEISSVVAERYRVRQGELLGYVKRVLVKDKGFPMSMLHLELHTHGTRYAYDWNDEKPESLRDPTPFLLQADQMR